MYEIEYMDKSISPPKAIVTWSSCLTKPALNSKNNIETQIAKKNILFDLYLNNEFVMYKINAVDVKYNNK